VVAVARRGVKLGAPRVVNEDQLSIRTLTARDGDAAVAVMGQEYVSDVALLRHVYGLPDRQRRGVALLLHEHLERQIHGVDRIIVAPTPPTTWPVEHSRDLATGSLPTPKRFSAVSAKSLRTGSYRR